MASLIPPMPNGVVPGSGYWNDWAEKLRTLVNSFVTGINWTLITGTPTTLLGYGITDAQNTSQKDQASGYAGLTAQTRIDVGAKTTDDLIVDNTAKGLVLKSANGHYWRVSVSNIGVLSATDLGTSAP